MYTERETTFPSPFTFLHTYVAPPSHQFRYLSSQFPYYIYCDITYQLFSLSLGFKKPRPILLSFFPSRPWMAYLMMMNSETDSPTVCGGTILNRQFLVTAAHCFCSSQLCIEGKIYVTGGRFGSNKTTSCLSPFPV